MSDSTPKFRHLHAHTTYSSLDGYGTPAQIADRLEQIKHDACSITDHGTVAGHLEYYSVLSKRGIKPLLGCEFYHRENMRSGIEDEIIVEKVDKNGKIRKSRQRPEWAHITILAKNNAGHRNLLKLSRASYEEGFRYKSSIDWDEIVKRQQGLIVMSGCLMGILSKQIVAGKDDLACKWLQYLQQRIENFYIEIIPCPDLPESVVACSALWQMSKELRIPAIITADSHFPRPEDHQYQDAMLCISTKANMLDPTRGTEGGPIKLPEYLYLCDAEEMLQRTKRTLPHVPEEEILEAMGRTVEVADSCSVELPRSSGPVYNIPFGETANSLLRSWVSEGRQYRRSLGLLPREGTPEYQTYLDRENREWEIIEHHGFENYFLIVTDIVRWSMGQKKLCIARGSAGGSLICWYLGITQVDPIKFDLPVERFIDETRPDLPDIDLDFDARYRDDVFHYAISKYGADKCAQIMAFSYYRGRAAVKDIGTAFALPVNITNQLAEMIPMSLDADEGMKVDTILERVFADTSNEPMQDILCRYPQYRLAAELEGQIRQTTKHAAGLIIGEKPLEEFVGIVAKPGEVPLVAADKDYAGKQGLLKIDALSVSELSVIAEVLEQAGKDFGWLFSLPLDDKQTFDMVGRGRSTGVFQLQGGAATKILQQVRPANIEEFTSVSALARPGPMQSGGLQEFIERKWGREPVPAYHPAIQKLVGKTYGVVIYQEQVMWLAKDVGGIPMKDVHKIRKNMTSRGGANFVAGYYPQYISHATQVVGVPKEQADRIWEQCLKAGNYVFNRAHVVAYGVVGYWSAYLKTHYPALFTAASCKYTEGDVKKKKVKISKLLQDFRENGGKFRLLHHSLSKENFSVLKDESNTIIGGFLNLDGVGPVTAKALVAGQPYWSWDEFFLTCENNRAKKLASLLREAGVHLEGQPLNAHAALQVAPWYVQLDFTPLECAFFETRNCIPLGALTAPACLEPDEDGEFSSSGFAGQRVSIGGKLTMLTMIDCCKEAKKYSRPPIPSHEPSVRCQMTVTDQTGSVDVFFGRFQWAKFLERVGQCDVRNPFLGDRGDGIGNGVYVTGRMSDDGARMWGDDFMVVKAAGKGK